MSATAASPLRARRRDAQERREALITAAAECFASLGYSVPLETIAERAGVGRGTLYRNFADREALALAIFSREVDRMAITLDRDAPIADIIATIARDRTAASSLFMRIAAELRIDDANRAAFQALGTRLEDILAPALRAAQARGEIDAGVTPRQIVTATRMAGSLLQPFMDAAETAAQLEEALAILMTGLRPR